MRSKILVVLFFWGVLSGCSDNEIAYADIYKVHQEFELQKLYANYIKAYKDSASAQIENYLMTVAPEDTAGIEAMKRSFYETVQKSVSLKTDSLNAIIWKRLNPLIQEYGRAKKYKMILGANGSGTLLYSDSTLDISDDLIKYVNDEYNRR